jgi:hypothetical protein
MVIAALMLAGPAEAQWFDDDEAPAGSGEILNPFTFKGFGLGSGGQVSTWIAPGDDLLGLNFLVRGGYAFDAVPIYIGLEVPAAYIKPDGIESDFALGNIGLNFKTRVDPDLRYTSIFTGWSLDIYIPTFQGGLAPRTFGPQNAGHIAGLLNTLLPAIHLSQEAISVVGTFDLVVPGHWIFFQFELSAATYFPVTHISERKFEGALLWGGVLGVNIAEPISFLVEIKGYTPLGVEDEDGTTAPTLFAISPGVRLRFGPFKPAIWVTIPLSDSYRAGWPDVIIGLDLAAWF